MLLTINDPQGGVLTLTNPGWSTSISFLYVNGRSL